MNLEDQSHEYPIVWFEPEINSEEKKDIKTAIEENKSISLFSEIEEMLEFCKASNVSFLMVVSRDVSEQKLLEAFENLELTCPRRLAGFEEDLVIPRLLNKGSQQSSHRVYVLCSRKDFNDEVLTKEDVEKVLKLNEIRMPATARDFCEEFLSWESKSQGGFYQPEKPDCRDEELVDKDFLECKEWCIGKLKELVFQRKLEKMKMIYYVALAQSQICLGEHKAALQHYKRVLTVFTGSYVGIHPLVGTLYDKLGQMYSKMGNNQLTKEYYIKALYIRKYIYGDIHDLVAASYTNLGSFYGSVGDEEAIECSLKALEIRKSLHGETDSWIAITLHDLALAYHDLKQDEKALEYFHQSLAIRKANNEEKHSASADLYNDIGSTYYRLQDYENAADSFTQALEIRRAISGEMHFKTLLLYRNLAEVYFRLEEYQKSLDFQLKALVISRSIYGEIHSKTSVIYNKIAEVYQSLGESEKAGEYQEKSLGVTISLNGQMREEIAYSSLSIANLYALLGKWERTFSYYLKALLIERFISGDQDPLTERAYGIIGEIYTLLERQHKELIYDKKSLKIQRFLPSKLAAQFKEMMKDEKNILYERGFFDDHNSSEEVLSGSSRRSESELSEASNDDLMDSPARLEVDDNNRIGSTSSLAEDEGNNSLLGKRNAPFEGSESEDAEPDVEKKVKQ